MNKKYLVAVRFIADNGNIVESNLEFNTDGPLTLDLLKEAKEKHCLDLEKRGIKCSVDDTIIYGIIPLDS